MLRILIQNNQGTLNLNPTNKSGWAPTHYAAKSGNRDLLELIHSLNVEMHQEEECCQEYFDLNIEGGSLLYTPLHLTVFSGYIHCSEELIYYGEVDLFRRNKDYFKPIDLTRGNLITYKIMKKGESYYFRKFFCPSVAQLVSEEELTNAQLISYSTNRFFPHKSCKIGRN